MVVVEEREQTKILLVRDRVVLVRVALGTLNRQPEKRLADGVHPVEHRVHAELLGVHASLFVQHRVPQEAGRDDLVLRRFRQQVTGELFDHELVVRQVSIQRVDDVVAIKRDLPRLVLFKAVRVGIPRRVEPVPSPTLTVVRRFEQPLDLFFVGVRCRIRQKRIDLINRGRQPNQIEMQSAQQRNLVGLGRLSQPMFEKLRCDKPINLVPHSKPTDIHLGNARPHWSLERPVRGILGPARHPALQQFDLTRGERLVLPFERRHPSRLVGAGHSLDEFARLNLARHDGNGSRLGSLGRGTALIQPQPRLPFLLIRPVTGKTVVRQDRPDVAVEVEGG